MEGGSVMAVEKSIMAVEKSTVRDGGWFCTGSREKYNGSREKHSEGWRVVLYRQ